MQPTLKQKWIAALESRKYRRETGRLKSRHDDRTFCPLGLLLHVSGARWSRPRRWNISPHAFIGTRRADKRGLTLTQWFRCQVGLSLYQMRHVSELNDSNTRKSAIIKFIRDEC